MSKGEKKFWTHLLYLAIIFVFVHFLFGCATRSGGEQKTSAADVLGAVVFGPPAAISHVFWTLYGTLAYPIALLDKDDDEVNMFWSAQVGQKYVSTKFTSHWAYYGNEPEKPVSAETLKPLERILPLSSVEIDLAFAPFQDGPPTRNMRGDETRPLK